MAVVQIDSVCPICEGRHLREHTSHPLPPTSQCAPNQHMPAVHAGTTDNVVQEHDSNLSDPFGLSNLAVSHFAQDEFHLASEHSLAAVRAMAAGMEAMRHRSVARQTTALYLASRLMISIRQLEAVGTNDAISLACLFSKTLADLPLPTSVRRGTLLYAVRMNVDAQNNRTACRLIEVFLAQEPVDSPERVSTLAILSRLQQGGSAKEDKLLPSYFCVACSSQVSCGDYACSVCGEPIRLCFKSQKLLEAPYYFSCAYCNAIFRPESVDASGCELCLGASLSRQDIATVASRSLHFSREDLDGDSYETTSVDSLDSMSSIGTHSTYSRHRGGSVISSVSGSVEIPSAVLGTEYRQAALRYLNAGNLHRSLHYLTKAIVTYTRLPEPFVYQEQARQCVQYKIALQLLTALRRVEASGVDVAYAGQLTVQLAELSLEVSHHKLCLNMAIHRNLKAGNFGIAARFITELETCGGLAPDFSAQLDDMLKNCYAHSLTNSSAPPYTCPRCRVTQRITGPRCVCGLEIWYCQAVFHVIEHDKAVVCPYCAAHFAPASKSLDSRCDYCNFRPLQEEVRF